MLSAKVWVKRKPEQRVGTSFSTLTESLTTLVLFVANVSGWRAVKPGSIYVKPSHWDLCLCLVPFQYFFFCDEVRVDKAEVSRPLGEKLLHQIQQQRVIERGFHPYLWHQEHILILSRICSTSCVTQTIFLYVRVTLFPSHSNFCLLRPVFFLDIIFTCLRHRYAC